MGYLGNLSYNLFMYPLEKSVLHQFRKSSVTGSSGRVLEVGVGTGVNTRYMDKEKIDTLTAVDISIRKTTVKSLKKKFEEIQFFEGSVEELPFESSSFDTILFTLVFCSVQDPEKGLSEIKRVLKDSGKLIFIEHVRPNGHKMRKIADKANNYWNSMSNGCNINRETLKTIEEAGFTIKPGSYKRKGVFITGIATKS